VSTAGKARADGTERYEDVMEAHRQHWEKMLAAPLVNLPVVTRGWDASPRCRPDVAWPFPPSPKPKQGHEYPYLPVVVGNTPARFEQLLQDAQQFIRRDPQHPVAVIINAWNEWTEGGYLLPEELDGTAPLEAIQRVFGKSGR